MTRAEELAHAAAGFVGAPFRLYGRDAATGLDCVGLIVASLHAIGQTVSDPKGYSLRNISIERWLECFERSGFCVTRAAIEPGDVLLTTPGPNQHHLMIAERTDTFIHAHAGLRAVVRQPIGNDVTPLMRWRLPS
ncbi:MAG: NlpC/P60 family protein [Pseudomonadota bacterium]|nr:NlpC/P60 family protein [Pseudomonadota bacterium]